MRCISSRCSTWVLIHNVILLYLISNDSVTVYGWTQNQVLCFSFDLNVAERVDLLESQGHSYSEHSFPSCSSYQIVIQLAIEFCAKSPCIEFRVVVEITRWFPCQVWEGLQVLVLILSMCKYEQVTWKLKMSQLRSRVSKIGACWID